MTALLLLVLAALQACSLPLSADGVAGLECGRVSAGQVTTGGAELCYRPVLDWCVVTLPGGECSDSLAWYPGGQTYEVWCDAWVGEERTGDVLELVECPGAK